MKEHYLVCGGAGFIGINLCIRLISEGHQVTVVDNLYCGDCANLPPQVSMIHKDICHLMDSDIPKGVTAIFNLACPASPKNYQANPIFTLSTCTQGVLGLLYIAQARNIPILQASTSEIYGEATVSPQVEEYRGNVSCTGIRSCYDEGKRVAESLCFEHHRKYGTKIRVVRIFNTYGPYMNVDDGRVISNFVNQALAKKTLTIYGDGSQTRSFCYVDDLVDGLIKMIHSKHIGPINLGNPDERTILSVATLINELTKNDPTVACGTLPLDDPTHRCPDITKAKEFLKWQPTTTLEAGLVNTIYHYKKLGEK